MRRYLCGVPKDECQGAGVAANSGLGKFQKVHSSPQEAFKCHVKWLEKQGYVRIANNEMQHKDGGPIRLLTKASKFGAVMRQGKTGEKGKGTSGSRVTPERKGKMPCSGTIIST